MLRTIDVRLMLLWACWTWDLGAELYRSIKFGKKCKCSNFYPIQVPLRWTYLLIRLFQLFIQGHVHIFHALHHLLVCCAKNTQRRKLKRLQEATCYIGQISATPTPTINVPGRTPWSRSTEVNGDLFLISLHRHTDHRSSNNRPFILLTTRQQHGEHTS